jgi:hypothetical protein
MPYFSGVTGILSPRSFGNVMLLVPAKTFGECVVNVNWRL